MGCPISYRTMSSRMSANFFIPRFRYLHVVFNTHHIMEKTMTKLLEEIAQKNKTNGFPSVGYVRLKQIVGPAGPLPISRSGFWAGVKNGKFPKPLKISPRVTVWKAEDIHALLAEIEMGGQ